MNLVDIGGTLGIIITALVAGGAGYKFVEKVLDLWSTSDARTSHNWREYAEKMESRLELVETDLDAERKARASAEADCGRELRKVWLHVGRLEGYIRKAGLELPAELIAEAPVPPPASKG